MDVNGFSQFGQDLFIDRTQEDAADAPHVDHVTAQIILQNYLDSRAQQKAAGGFIKSLD